MKFEINRLAQLPIACPKCGHQQSELVSRLRDNPEVVCGGCGITIAINGDQLDAFMNMLEGFGS